MAAISITAANVLMSSQGISDKSHNAGTTIVQGKSVYLDVNNLWQLANTLTSAVTAAATGIAISSAALNQPIAVCTKDPSFTLGGTMTAGVAVVVGSASGDIDNITDVTTGWFTTVLGVPTSTTVLNLNPIAGGISHA